MSDHFDPARVLERAEARSKAGLDDARERLVQRGQDALEVPTALFRKYPVATITCTAAFGFLIAGPISALPKGAARWAGSARGVLGPLMPLVGRALIGLLKPPAAGV